MERIVAVACKVWAPFDKSPKGKFQVVATLPPPARHHDILWGYYGVKPEDQGFLTSEGRFVGRREAKGIAENAGQLLEREAGLPELYSEDVW